jgi:hypothetical protein
MSTEFEYPADYLDYLNSFEDHEMYSDSGFIGLFPLNDLDKMNEEYQVHLYAPDFIAIGTNGGGVGIFINKNTKQLYSIPFVGMEAIDAVLLANSFTEFIYKFENSDLEII